MKARVTVVERIYHQGTEGAPHLIEDGWTVLTESQESHFPKVFEVGEAWTPVNSGWIEAKACSVMRLANIREKRKTIPTPAERADAAARIVELSFSDPPQAGGPIILPGESLRLRPGDLARLRLRCLKGKTRVAACFFPGDPVGPPLVESDK